MMTDDYLDRLKKLAELRDSDVLTDEEFATEKAKLLAGPTDSVPTPSTAAASVPDTEVWKRMANHSQGGRSVGGKLTMTQQTLSFRPNGIDRATGGASWSIPLVEIEGAGIAPRTGGLFDGGMRKRLEITTKNGGRELFVVNGAAVLVDAILLAVSKASA